MTTGSVPIGVPIQGWEIKYRGDAKLDAAALQQNITAAGLHIHDPVEVPEDDARLGAGEVILTIIATAAAKAVVDVVATQLREYLRKRLTSQPDKVGLRVVVRRDKHSSGKQHSIDFKGATADLIDQFVTNVKESILNTIAA
jgi:hypothetical protein